MAKHKHLGFRIVDADAPRTNDFLLLPDWTAGQESIPIETPPGVFRDPAGNPQIFALPRMKDSDRLMDALTVAYRGERLKLSTAEGSEVPFQIAGLNLTLIVSGNSAKYGAKILLQNLPTGCFTVLKCGETDCENLMAVPDWFWGRGPINLNIDPCLFAKDDRRNAFQCWDCWEPRSLRYSMASDPLEVIDLEDDEAFRQDCRRLDKRRRKIKHIRARRPPPDVWFAGQ